MPKDLMEQSKLQSLAYENALEGRRSHASPELLRT
jgi:hypothetical protein